MSKKMTLAEYISTRRYVVLYISVETGRPDDLFLESRVVTRGDTADIEGLGWLEVEGAIVWAEEDPDTLTHRDTWSGVINVEGGNKVLISASTDLDQIIQEGVRHSNLRSSYSDIGNLSQSDLKRADINARARQLKEKGMAGTGAPHLAEHAYRNPDSEKSDMDKGAQTAIDAQKSAIKAFGGQEAAGER